MTKFDVSSTTKQESGRARTPAPKVAPAEIHASAPGLGWYSDNVLFGEMWERPELSKRDRSIVTVTSLITRGHIAQLTGHFNRALTHGVQPTEIVEMITHLAFYAGWPCAMSSVGVMQQVFKQRGIDSEQVVQGTSDELPVSHAGSDRYASLCAPAFAEFTERVVINDLWARPELAPRDRSLVTIATLIAQGETEQLDAQVELGLRNGLYPEEISEALAHLAFYAGWPRATAAMHAIEAVFRRHGNT